MSTKLTGTSGEWRIQQKGYVNQTCNQALRAERETQRSQNTLEEGGATNNFKGKKSKLAEARTIDSAWTVEDLSRGKWSAISRTNVGTKTPPPLLFY